VRLDFFPDTFFVGSFLSRPAGLGRLSLFSPFFFRRPTVLASEDANGQRAVFFPFPFPTASPLLIQILCIPAPSPNGHHHRLLGARSPRRTQTTFFPLLFNSRPRPLCSYYRLAFAFLPAVLAPSFFGMPVPLLWGRPTGVFFLRGKFRRPHL